MHLYGVCQMIIERIEATNSGGKFDWKHHDATVDEIDAVASVKGFFINQGARFYKMGYIGNMDTQVPAPF